MILNYSRDLARGNQKSCILTFASDKDASTFYMEYNGKPFSGVCIKSDQGEWKAREGRGEMEKVE